MSLFLPTEQNPKLFSPMFKADPTPSLTGIAHSFYKHFKYLSVLALGILRNNIEKVGDTQSLQAPAVVATV